MKIGDKVLMKYYVPVHGYMFDVISLDSKEAIAYVNSKPDNVAMVSNESGSFGDTIDKLFELEVANEH